MQPNRKSIRLPVVRRQTPGWRRNNEDGEHSWAVSYADMLMVLLSFFIVFFSMSPEAKTSVIQRIAAQAGTVINGVGGKGTGFGNGTGAGSDTGSGTGGATAGGSAANAISEAIRGIVALQVKTGATPDRLTIEFPENIYGKGGTELDSENLARLQTLMDRLRPFARELQIIIVGHSDTSAVSRVRSPYLRNNHDLSAIRASRALASVSLPREAGYIISVQGDAAQMRASRTISVLVQSKGEIGNE